MDGRVPGDSGKAVDTSGGSNRDVTIQDATETLADKKTPIVMCTMHLKQHIMNQFLCRLHSLQLTNFSIKKY